MYEIGTVALLMPLQGYRSTGASMVFSSFGSARQESSLECQSIQLTEQ